MVSEKDEDPLFDDDWEASTYLYPNAKDSSRLRKPPVTLLVMSVRENVLFDPSREELAVADGVVAISVAQSSTTDDGKASLQTIAVRTIDPPSRLTGAGVPNSLNTTGGSSTLSAAEAAALREKGEGQTVWRPPRGGIKRAVIAKMIKTVVDDGGVGQEVLDGLAAVGT